MVCLAVLDTAYIGGHVHRPLPREDHGFFHRLHERLRRNGQLNKSRRPIRVPQRNQEAVDAVQQALVANPHTSTRAIAIDLNMNHITVHKIIKHSLGQHPFKRHTTHKLIPRDMSRRLNFCEYVLDHVS